MDDYLNLHVPEMQASEEDHARRSRKTATPEVELAEAVMSRALLDLAMQGDHPEVVEVRSEARAWVRSKDASWPFSFESLCALLGLEPEATRAQALSGAVEWKWLCRPSKKLQIGVQLRQQSARRRKSVGEVKP